ncbi:MAG: sugar nucleotide-binding protein [Gemmataceae bacterium]|nr:sugar nucleotide-binding protein [Gemmataceae bacterium]
MIIDRAADAPLEMWGGIECTYNRVGDGWLDQLEFSGHRSRPDDLERIAALGIRTVRYPALWEYAATADPAKFDWSWADDRLPRLQTLGIRPIVGLVHHGSGPRHVDLLHADFASALAGYAGRVAERFPWVRDYTPVNEPLTTARFSALYGFWYPHARTDRDFATAMLNECRATVLAMRAIREVQPEARLVQTEDLGKTHTRPKLAYQAKFENERRWLTFDLLCGRVDRRHPMGKYLLRCGVTERDLAWFQENPCPPDLLGINHYVTSERFLDDEIARYPAEQCGGNKRHRYADVEAVRILPEGNDGPAKLLKEAWDRFRIPIAITEAHLGCTREEQVRWLHHMWRQAYAARASGVDVRAVTAWALLGSFDWDSLVTQARGRYEPGAFDVRGPVPHATALATLIRELANDLPPTSPVLAQPGWWERPERLLFVPPPAEPRLPGKPLLIAGARGRLGQAIARMCEVRALPYRLLSRDEMDISDPASVADLFEQHEPWAVVNAAGFASIETAETAREDCFRDNVLGPVVLAERCAAVGIPFVTFSSDLVFDGERRTFYREGDAVRPLCVYGETKAEAERRVLHAHPSSFIIRAGAFFGPWDERNFLVQALRSLTAGDRFCAASDSIISPTYLPDVAHATLDLLLDGATGVWHLANQGETTWADFAREAARRAGLDPLGIDARPTHTLGWRAARPAYSALASERGHPLPPLESALDRFLAARPPLPAA